MILSNFLQQRRTWAILYQQIMGKNQLKKSSKKEKTKGNLDMSANIAI